MKKVWRFKLLIATLALVIFTPNRGTAEPKSKPDVCQQLENYHHLEVRDVHPNNRIRGYVCTIVQNNPNLQGVLTLKHMDNRGDWDILVGTHFDTNSKTVYGIIDYQNNSGNLDEILSLPIGDKKSYVVVVFPKSNEPSRACLSFHSIDISEVAVRAAADTAVQNSIELMISVILGQPKTQEDGNARSRAIAGGYAVLRRNNLAAVGYDVMLNEISTQLANTFGGSSLLFDFGVNYFGEYLEQSGKFLFEQNTRCQN